MDGPYQPLQSKVSGEWEIQGPGTKAVAIAKANYPYSLDAGLTHRIAIALNMAWRNGLNYAVEKRATF